MPEFKTVRGMRDFLPEEAELLRYIEAHARSVAKLYGYKEIITPIVEPYELLSAKAGEEVRSRMFVFKDLGDRNVALRPEFTASVARLVATTFRNEPRPFRLFSVGTIYRYDEPQRGRYREFWQSNYELMGSTKPEADAEILMLTDSLVGGCGLKNYAFRIGHVGVLRGIFKQEGLNESVQNSVMQLMDKKQYDDAFRILENAHMSKNGLEVLRKLVGLRGSVVFDVIEKMTNCVEGYESAVEAIGNFKEILTLFLESKSKVELVVDAGFARGLEYYTGMILEIYIPYLDIALGGGGRYDKLIGLFGGEATPAVGIAHGLDRMMLGSQMQKAELVEKKRMKTVLVPVNERMIGKTLEIARNLREEGMLVEVEVMRRKIAKALEDADRRKMDFAVIVGEKELQEGKVVVRDLVKREQSTAKIDRIVDAIRK